MYSASSTYRNLIDSGARGNFGSYLILSGGAEELEIAKLTKEVQLMDTLSIGNVVSAVANITLYTNVSFENAVFNLYTELENEAIPHGVFNVLEAPTNEDGKISVLAYDNVKLLDRTYTSALTYPCDIVDVLNEIETECGVDFDLTGLTIPGIQVSQQYSNCREAVAHIAEIFGRNVIADRTGKLKFVWFYSSGLTIDANNHYSFTPNENNFTLTKLSCKTSDETITAGTNDGGVMSFSNVDMTQEQLTVLLSQLAITYRGCECEFIGDPCIDVGDVLTISDTEGNSYLVPIMNLMFEYDGGCKNIIESYSTTNMEVEVNTSQSGTAKIKEIENSVDRLAIALRTEYSTKAYTQAQVEATSEQLQASVEESVASAVSSFERENYTLTIEADDGNTFTEENSTLAFRATLFKNGSDITAETSSRWFRWYKKSRDIISDSKWNVQANRWGTSITVSTADVTADTVLYCKCVIPVQENLVDNNGNNMVDSDGNQIVVNVASVLLTCNIPITESFSQYKSTIQMLKNQILLQVDSNNKMACINMLTGETDSTIEIITDILKLQGDITANGNVHIDTDGNMTCNNIVCNNGYFDGEIYTNKGKVNFTSSTTDSEGYSDVQILTDNELSFMKMNTETTEVSTQTNISSSYITTDGDLDVYGTTTLASSPVISSDENKKNTPTKFDERYYKLAENISFKLFKYNDGTSDRFHSGVFAQEVEQYMTECDISSQEFAVFCIDEKGVYSVRYEELLVLMAWYSRERMNKLESRICFLEERMMSDGE